MGQQGGYSAEWLAANFSLRALRAGAVIVRLVMFRAYLRAVLAHIRAWCQVLAGGWALFWLNFPAWPF